MPRFDPLRVWLLARLVLPAGFVMLAPNLAGEFGAWLLSQLPYPHGMLKWGLESSQGLLLRQREIPVVMLVAGLGAATLSALPGRAWLATAGVLGAAALLAPRFATWPLVVFMPLLWLNGATLADLPARRTLLRHFAAAPGSLLVSPLLVAFAVGLVKRRATHALFAGLSGSLLGFGWIWTDCLASYAQVRTAMEAWPTRLLDPRITLVAQSPVGVRADWHAVQIVDDHAIVVGETRPRLIAFDLDSNAFVERPLQPRWGPESAAPLDSETDLETGLTWVVDGGRRLLELRWTGRGWETVRALPLPVQMSYAYLRRTADDRLIVSSVQANNSGPRQVLVGTLPELADLRVVKLRAGEAEAPMPREVAWLEPIGKLVLAPEFGDRLWLSDLTTGRSEPWVKTASLNGKMAYLAKNERLLLAQPNRVEMWMVDPRTGEVDWTLPTQPGVRAVAVDEDRGLVVSASVLTGQVLVQDLRTGEVRDVLGTVMPMVRELALAEDRGEAVLTTWAAVYRFPYAEPRAASDTAAPAETVRPSPAAP